MNKIETILEDMFYVRCGYVSSILNLNNLLYMHFLNRISSVLNDLSSIKLFRCEYNLVTEIERRHSCDDKIFLIADGFLKFNPKYFSLWIDIKSRFTLKDTGDIHTTTNALMYYKLKEISRENIKYETIIVNGVSVCRLVDCGFVDILKIGSDIECRDDGFIKKYIDKIFFRKENMKLSTADIFNVAYKLLVSSEIKYGFCEIFIKNSLFDANEFIDLNSDNGIDISLTGTSYSTNSFCGRLHYYFGFKSFNVVCAVGVTSVGVTTSQSGPSTECHTGLASNHEQNPAGIPPSPSDPSSRDPQKP